MHAEPATCRGVRGSAERERWVKPARRCGGGTWCPPAAILDSRRLTTCSAIQRSKLDRCAFSAFPLSAVRSRVRIALSSLLVRAWRHATIPEAATAMLATKRPTTVSLLNVRVNMFASIYSCATTHLRPLWTSLPAAATRRRPRDRRATATTPLAYVSRLPGSRRSVSAPFRLGHRMKRAPGCVQHQTVTTILPIC